jgi:hypothetical protein
MGHPELAQGVGSVFHHFPIGFAAHQYVDQEFLSHVRPFVGLVRERIPKDGSQ